MIKRLVVHRFRGIREGALDDLGKINLLIGPNNSGKTAILEMLYLGGTSGRPVQLLLDDVPAEEGENLAFQATTSVRFDFPGLEPLPRLRTRHGYRGQSQEIPVILTDEGGLAVNLKALLSEAPLRAFRLGSPLPEWGVKDRTRFSKKDIGTVALFSLQNQEGVPRSLIPAKFLEAGFQLENSRWHYLWDPQWVYRWHRQEPIDSLAIWAEEGQPPASDKVVFFDFHAVNRHFTLRFAQWAKNQRWNWMAKIQEHLINVFPEMKGMTVEIDDAPDRQREETGYLRSSEGRLSIDQFGDGARHAFKVLATLVALCEVVDDEHPGLFLWEDPELFMHPATLGRLLNEVTKLVRDKPIQVFMSTQSLEVLAWFVQYLENIPDEEAQQVRAFRLDLKEGRLHAHKFTGRGIGSWFRLFGDPRLSAGEEMASPLYYLLMSEEES